LTDEFKARQEALFKAIRPTTFIDPYSLKKSIDADLLIASETFQITGSFKFRAAYNLASSVPNKMLITASSGNFGQALACACKMLAKQCIVVMPDNSASVKIESTRAWGAQVELVDTKLKSRATRVAELAAQYPEAYVASAYDDPLVIEGNSSLGFEIGNSEHDIDLVIAPIGGGGLSSGLIEGIARSARPNLPVYLAEPALANDAAQSLARGEIVSFSEEAQTIADGARTLSVGKHNFEILKNRVAGIIEVPESFIAQALRLYFLKANLKVEPTGALPLAAFLYSRASFAVRKVLLVASGGNVDPAVFFEILNAN
jgi:threonine dehydratase